MSSPTKPTTSIDDLPPELICELFEYLHPKDLAVCSMVNRRWHSIYADFKVHRPVATDYSYHYDLRKWSYPDRSIEEIKLCSKEMFRRLAEKPLLSNLKHLALCGHPSEFDLNKLNRFRQLVHLEVHIDWLDKNVNLNLPRLKVLALHSLDYRCAPSINCPQLSTLVYGEKFEDEVSEVLLDVKHPEMIRKLETNLLGQKLAPFKNVECLVTREFKAISRTTLLSLPRLKELRYNKDIQSLFKFFEKVGTLKRIKRTLSEFMDDAIQLRGPDFWFSFSGFQLTQMNVDQIDFGVNEGFRKETVSREYVYMKNYQLVEPGALSFVYDVDYDRLLRNVTGEFPRCFSKKFTGIKSVEVWDKVPDANQFLWFLKSLRSLRSLDLYDSELSQEFYDLLPASARTLATLHLIVGDFENRPQLNFDFIGKLSHLSDLSIDSLWSLESLSSLVGWLGKLELGFICIQPNGKEDFYITKQTGREGWWVFPEHAQDETQNLFKTENAVEILSFFEELQSD